MQRLDPPVGHADGIGDRWVDAHEARHGGDVGDRLRRHTTRA